MDDVQDYFLAPSQIELISLFDKKDAPFTIGIIGGLIGTDPKLIESIKGGLAADPPIEIANHSWSNKVLSKISKTEQEELIQKANEKITSVFGVTPTVFIPPENLFNNDTISVLKSNGFTHISYATTTREPPIFKKSSFYEFPVVPYTAILDPSIGLWRHTSNDQILEKIEESIFEIAPSCTWIRRASLWAAASGTRATGEILGSPAAEQAKGPFLNPVEQALPSAAALVTKVCEASYGNLFRQVWGVEMCDPANTSAAYDAIGYSIAAYEGSPEVNAFTSKYDYSLVGKAKLSQQERLGFALFQGKGKCKLCHVTGGKQPLFTDFTYDNLGFPKNPENPAIPTTRPSLTRAWEASWHPGRIMRRMHRRIWASIRSRLCAT